MILYRIMCTCGVYVSNKSYPSKEVAVIAASKCDSCHESHIIKVVARGIDIREWIQAHYSDKAEMFDLLYYKILPAIPDEQLIEMLEAELEGEDNRWFHPIVEKEEQS